MEDPPQLLIFPTYATKENNGWRIQTRGWTYTINSGSRKLRLALALARKVSGAAQAEEAQSIFTDRFSMLMANTARFTTVHLQVSGLTLPTHMELQSDPTRSPGFISSEASMENMQYRQTSPFGNETRSVRVHAESGYFSSLLSVSEEAVQTWLKQAPTELNNASRHGHTLVQLEGSLEHALPVAPAYGIVDLVGPRGISVISDIDDTIKISDVVQGTLALMEKALFRHSQPVPGMAQVYQKWWEQGAHFHYVSNTPWQLFPTLQKFFAEHQFPPGSAHLKMWDHGDRSRMSFLHDPADSKREATRRIIRDFPQRKFILVGDSGQRDMELYADMAKEFPDQVLKVFIRDITTPPLLAICTPPALPRRTPVEPNLMEDYTSHNGKINSYDSRTSSSRQSSSIRSYRNSPPPPPSSIHSSASPPSSVGRRSTALASSSVMSLARMATRLGLVTPTPSTSIEATGTSQAMGQPENDKLTRNESLLVQFFERVNQVFGELHSHQWELFEDASRLSQCPRVKKAFSECG
ncbi:hypothetical protein IWQ62_001385 [Dispira parvispora]|uniref:Phosphatidate phosphatase APP1 catalytic domain-containing protein n=1 Tax=Dispira parvispora TaxID=1520584 RepID=A0A9W8AV57_9FUNG|nr:hypothetical protein IWQ62_001385 [Dispira parvispora]